MPVKHRPNASEIIRESAAVPIGVNVRVAPQIKNYIVVNIHVGKLAMDA